MSSWSPLVLILSLDALTGWSLLLEVWLAGECMVDRPLRKVLKRVTKEVLFLKLERNQASFVSGFGCDM